jgi:drug/metabolite transporter (DMT)-like permease
MSTQAQHNSSVSNPTTSMGGLEWGLLIILSLIWGCSYFFFKILAVHLPPFTVVLGRVAIAGIALNAVLLLRGVRLPRDLGTWKSLLVMGTLNNVLPFALIVYGETKISSGLASILNAMTPIFSVLTAHFVSAEKLNAAKITGVIFGFAGVAILLGPSALSGIGSVDVTCACACLLAALSYAFAGIYGRRFRHLPSLVVATGQITASVVLSLPLAVLIDRPWTLPMPSAQVWWALIGLALMCTALAYVIYFRILAVAGATNVLLVTFLVPISALGLGAMFLSERITLLSIAGMLLIGIGLAAIDGRLTAKLRHGVERPPSPSSP